MLHYEPSPKRFPSRAQRIDVDIECRYQRLDLSFSYFQQLVCVKAHYSIHNLQTLCRNHHVYQLTVQPTWETAVVRKRLKGSPNDFQIELMDGTFKDLRIVVI